MMQITPKVAIAFKKLFGIEENQDLLLSLINSIVSPEDQVEEITLLNPYNERNFSDSKLSIIDIKAKSIDGKLFNIGIQIPDDANYDKRALYYWSRLYIDQLKKGGMYSDLAKAIGIHILNFDSICDVEKYHNVFYITEKDTGIRYFKALELHTIELNKFYSNDNEELSSLLGKIKTSLDRWVTFLTRHDLLNKNNLPKELDDSALKKALTVLEIMNFSSLEQEIYEGQLKWLMTAASSIETAAQKAKAEIISRMLDNGLALEVIAQTLDYLSLKYKN